MKIGKVLAVVLCAVLLMTAVPVSVFADEVLAEATVKPEVQAEKPAEEPEKAPAEEAPAEPAQTREPDAEPTRTPEASAEPAEPTAEPSDAPTAEPSAAPVAEPTQAPDETSLSVEVRDAAAEEGAALFAAEVKTNFDGALAYRWQRLDVEAYQVALPADEEDFWLDIPDEERPELKVEGLDPENYARYLYRCAVTAGELVARSGAARVTGVETLPAATPAAEARLEGKAAAVSTGKCGTSVNWTLYDDGALKITGTGGMYNYGINSSALPPWYSSYRDSIKSVLVESGVTAVGNTAFYNCASLKSVTLADSVTSLGTYAFYGCTALPDVAIPSGVMTIGEGTFFGCASLTGVTLPVGLKTIGAKAFMGCASMAGIDIPSGVTDIGQSAFSGCSGLKSFAVPSGVTSLSTGVLYECGALTSVSLPEGLTVIGANALVHCKSLASVSIPKSVTEVSYGAFTGCVKLATVELQEGLKTLGPNVFSECTGLTGMEIPDGVTAISDCLFYNCSNLTSVKLPDSVITIGNASFLGTKLATLALPDGVTSIGSEAFAYCASLTNIKIPPLVDTIDGYAFQNCSRLASISLPRGILYVAEYAFVNCGRLRTVYFSGTRAEWLDVLLNTESGNNALKSAKVYYSLDVARVAAPDQIYTGSALTPKPAVTFGGVALREGADYTLAGYADNVNAGAATVTIRGAGLYAGTQTGTFLIAPKDLGACSVSATGEKALSGEVLDVAVTVLDAGKELVPNVDYTHVVAADGSVVTIEGIGNYAGTLTEAVDYRALAARGTCGGALTWRLYETGRLVIDGEGAMEDYAAGSAPWYGHRDQITSVAIGEGVSRVSENAFHNCDALTGFAVAFGNPAYRAADGALYTLSDSALLRYPAGKAAAGFAVPDGVTKISASAFQGCSGLTSIQLPASLAVLGGDALGGLTGLTAIRVALGNPNFSALGGALYNRDRTALLRYPAGNAEETIRVPDGVVRIADRAFQGGAAIGVISLPASVTGVGPDAFSGRPPVQQVRFYGNPGEWNAITVAAGNEALLAASVQFDLAAFTVRTEADSYPHTGSAISAPVIVSRGDTTLLPGTDYLVAYASNVDVGTATAFITGAGSYAGNRSATFEITSPNVTAVALLIDAVTVGAGQTVSTIADTARVTPASAVDKALAWSSDNAAIARVDEGGRITGVKAGACKITATSRDNAGASASVTVSVVARGKGVTAIRLNASALTAYPGSTATLTAALSPSAPANRVIVWKSSDASVASVANGIVTGVARGTAIITAIASSGHTAACAVSVAPRYASLTLDKSELTLGAGEKYALGYTASNPDDPDGGAAGDPVGFVTSSARIATVNPATGEIKGVKAGFATITARTASGLTAACKVTVKNAPPKVSITAPRPAIGAGESMALAAVLPGGTAGAVAWSLPDGQKALAAIDQITGVLTAGPASGIVTPTARTYNGRTATISIAIASAPSYIVLNRTALTLCAGDKRALACALPAGSAGAVSFTSDNLGVVTVDAGGVVTAGSIAGTAAVRAETYNGRYARCAVTVVDAPNDVALQMASTEFGTGESRQILSSVSPVNIPCTLAFASSNPRVATVSDTGLVRGVKAGLATITVTAYNGVSRTIGVTIRNAPSGVSISVNAKLGLDETVPVQTTTSAGSTGSVAIASSNSEILRVNPDNTVTAMALGSAVLTATTYNGKKAVKTVSVLPAPTDSTLRLIVDDGYGGFIYASEYETTTFTVAKGDWTTVLVNYYEDSDDDEDDEDYEEASVPEELAAGTVTIESTDPGAVSFGAGGKITFVKSAKTDIVCTAYNGVSRVIHLNIIDAPDAIELSADGPALCSYSEYEILDSDDYNILELYSFLHYTITSSNPSAIRPYRYTDDEYVEDYGILTAGKMGTADITVKLFNGLTSKKRLSVRRNLFFDEYRPSLDDVDEDDFDIFFKSAEILAPNKVTVDFYILNNGPLKLGKLYDFEIGFVVDEEDLCYIAHSSFAVNVPAYSIKPMRLTFTGRSVDPEVATSYDLTEYTDGGSDVTYGWFDAYNPYDDYEGDDDYDDYDDYDY